MDVKKILINSVWYGVIPKISTLINILLLPALTPFLTPKDYGIWGIVSSYTNIALALYTMGLHMHLTNSFYENKADYIKIWSRILSLLIIFSFVYSLLFILILFTIFSKLELSYKVITIVLSCFPILFNPNSVVASHLLTLKDKPKQLVIRNLISSILGLIVLFFSIYYFKLGYLGFILSSSTSSIISFIIFISPIWVNEKIIPRLDFNINYFFSLLKICLPVIPHALGFVFLSSSSRIIMTMYNIPINDIGLFSNGYLIGDYITIVSVAVVTALTPKMQELYRQKKLKEYRDLYYFSQTITIFSIVLFAIWLPEIYLLLIKNKNLQPASNIASYICFANSVIPLYFFISNVIFIKKHTKQLLWLVFVPGILNIILNIIFIPFLGYSIAIFSSLVSYWSLLLIPMFIKYHKIITSNWLGNLNKLFYLLLILLIAFFISITVQTLDLKYKIVFTFIFCFTFLFILINFSKKNI